MSQSNGLSLNRENSLLPLSELAMRRFWKRVIIGAPDDCWQWTGRKNHKGYGRPRFNKMSFFAHRIAYLLANGSIPDDSEVIRHTCDNPSCVNPAHLVSGSINDNVQDRDQKDRTVRGQSNGRAKLTEDEVLQIKQSHEKDFATYATLAKQYGVCTRQIYMIATGRSWSHLR